MQRLSSMLVLATTGSNKVIATCRLSLYSYFAGVGTESTCVLLKPLQSLALILESNIGLTSTSNLITIHETERTQSVSNTSSHDRLANLDRVLNEEGLVVSSVNGSTLYFWSEWFETQGRWGCTM
jgi:hypothetical protein